MCEKDRERIITAGDVVAPRERRNELVTNVAAHSLPQPEACGADSLPWLDLCESSWRETKLLVAKLVIPFLSTNRSFLSTPCAFLTYLSTFILPPSSKTIVLENVVGLWTLSACRRADMCLVFEISRLTSHNV